MRLEWPMGELFRTARNEQESAALELLGPDGPHMLDHELFKHVTLKLPAEGFDDDGAVAVLDWDGVIAYLDDLTDSSNEFRREEAAMLAVACSLARGYKIDLAKVATAVSRRPKLLARVAYSILSATGNQDFTIRWPKESTRPPFVRIVDHHGTVIQEAGHCPEAEWHQVDMYSYRETPW